MDVWKRVKIPLIYPYQFHFTKDSLELSAPNIADVVIV